MTALRDSTDDGRGKGNDQNKGIGVSVVGGEEGKQGGWWGW